MTTVRVYHGESGQYIQDLTDLSVIEYTLGPNGNQNARVVVPSVGTQLHHTKLFPEGVGAFVRIDPSVPVPDPFIGRIEIPQFGGADTEVSLNLKGPEEWLSVIGVPLQATFNMPAAHLVRETLLASTAQTWVKFGTSSPSTLVSVPYQTSGTSIWGLMTDLAEMRNEEFYLYPDPQGIGFQLDWRHPLDSVDLSSTVVLEEGYNCALSSSAMNLGQPRDNAIGVALSLGMGDEVLGTLVSAPPTARLGIRDAFQAVFSTAAVRRLVGTGSDSYATPETSLVSQQAIEAAVESMLRRSMTATGTAQIADIDPALWPSIRPGVIVGGIIKDPFGLFENCLLRIRSVTFALLPVLGCTASVELWAVDRERD